jgi:hypothetical protein
MFVDFSKHVHLNYDTMSKGELFVVDVEDIFASYLAAFPEGTNPIFRERTEHDCNCCKQFIRRLGKLVSITPEGTINTVWDGGFALPAPYNIVAERMAELVRQAPILSVFRTKERQYGIEHNYETETGKRWNHFHGRVADKHYSLTPEKLRGDMDDAIQVFGRGMRELNLSDMDTVIDLIEANNLYRGEENLTKLKAYRALKAGYDASPSQQIYILQNMTKPSALLRNSSLGTLLIDLAAGTDLEIAVKKYEDKVSGTNFKRPKALITERMIQQAVAKLTELDLEHAVERRHATLEDINVNDVLFVDNEVRGKMKGGLTDLLMSSSQVHRGKGLQMALQDPPKIKIADFLKLGAKSIQLYLLNEQRGNFVSLTAPKYPSTGRLFKWANDFAWAYDGEVADSIKERVKRAGGNVDAKLRVSLSWHCGDDLDLYARCPTGHVYYGNKAGILDVDMNGLDRQDNIAPVENLAWSYAHDGRYVVGVNQFSRRTSNEQGYEVEFFWEGKSTTYSYPRFMKHKEDHELFSFSIVNGKMVGFTVGSALTQTSGVQEKWGVKTLTPVRVDTIMLSPNHWDDAGSVGNRHYFFILENCKNPEPVRGFFNEYLRGDLEPHRKVFEVLSSKTKCEPTDRQLSGVGFSSTRRDSVIAIADGRTYEVEF